MLHIEVSWDLPVLGSLLRFLKICQTSPGLQCNGSLYLAAYISMPASSNESGTAIADGDSRPEVEAAIENKEAQVLLELEGEENPLHWSRRKKVPSLHTSSEKSRV